MRNTEHRAAGFTVVEILVVLLILAVIAAVSVPTLIGYVNDSARKTCEINRQQLLSYYPVYLKLTGGGATAEGFADYAEENRGDLGDVCPKGGVCMLGIDDGGNMTVTCSFHDSLRNAYAILPVDPALSPDERQELMLSNARIIFEAFNDFAADFLEEYPGIASREFFSVANAAEGVDYTVNGVKRKIFVSTLFGETMEMNGVTFANGKIYMKTDAVTGKYTYDPDYVVVKIGDVWAKYSLYATQTGYRTAENAYLPPTAE